MSGRGRWSRRTPVGYVTLAVLAYLPAVLSSPGSMPADTKLGLYLNPGRLISQAHLTWDRGLFGGWVPHQMVAYLWPTGPWYWLGDRLGLPDWLVHRLWIGTLMVAAGAGVMWLARRLGLTLAAAWVAAVVYQCSPYVLAYVSRTSVMLLPWAAVGWLTGLAATSVLNRGWRAPAAVGLVVATVGSVNATALAMVLPAPVLMMLSLRWQGRVSWRQLAAAAGRLLGIGVAVSLWWIVMVSI
jgi:arabinofuranan 3-O-arabinosyltransferase